MQKVSICIPVFNGGPYLSDALHSAAAQSYEHIEILISDNGSTNDSPEIIEQFVRNCGRPARRVRGALPRMVQNWNHLDFSAQGAWIKYLFHDDMLQPNCVERMVAAANRAPRVALVFSRRHVAASGDSSDPLFQQLVRDLEQLHSVSYPFRRDEGWYLGRRDLLWHRTTNFIGEPTSVLMSRSAFLAANGFSLRLRQLVDYELWLRLMTMGNVVFVDSEDCIRAYSQSCDARSARCTIRGPFHVHDSKNCCGTLLRTACALFAVADQREVVWIARCIVRLPSSHPGPSWSRSCAGARSTRSAMSPHVRRIVDRPRLTFLSRADREPPTSGNDAGPRRPPAGPPP
jgi:glycosyltransferase involved in cell wall biosynthesis